MYEVLPEGWRLSPVLSSEGFRLTVPLRVPKGCGLTGLIVMLPLEGRKCGLYVVQNVDSTGHGSDILLRPYLSEGLKLSAFRDAILRVAALSKESPEREGSGE